jgi:hypothetical protein
MSAAEAIEERCADRMVKAGGRKDQTSSAYERDLRGRKKPHRTSISHSLLGLHTSIVGKGAEGSISQKFLATTFFCSSVSE